ncbi:MAG: FtsX-like permease family protein [Nitrospiraceae bacterium]|nr:FtsX-like permease family protein [Nitrospiraceae bacterium]
MIRMAWRETRAAWRHFLYFLVCIAIGVGALVGISLFAANVERAVTQEARGLLGGDLEIRLTRPISREGRGTIDALAQRDIDTTHVSELVAMAAHGGSPTGHGQPTQIVELKAVEPGYPFYGVLRVEPPQDLAVLLESQFQLCPRACYGAVVQEALLIRMGLAVGDRLKIGQGLFVITGIVRTEPDRMANAFTLGPRVLISQEGLRAAELVKTGSRLRERYLLKIPSSMEPQPLVYELRGRLASDSARVSGYRDAQPQLKQVLDQLTRYLGLIGLTALFVGGLGVATSIHAFVREKLTTIAILKTIGADSATVIGVYVVQALLLGLAGSSIGLLMGILLQLALPSVIATLLASDLLSQVRFTTGLTSAAWAPLLKGLALGLLSTLLFALWPLLAIREVKPASIFRREMVTVDAMSPVRMPWWSARFRTMDRVQGLVSGTIACGLALLSMWQAGSAKVGLIFIGAFVAAVLLLGVTAWAAVQLLKRCPRPGGLTARHALGNIIRPGSQAMGITIAIGIGVMVVLTVSLVERSLLGQMGENRPTDAPTFFFIDIQPDQAEGFTNLLRERGEATPQLTPLVRSRLSAVNGEPVKLESGSEEEDQKEKASSDKEARRKKWYLAREYVLTFLQDLPKDNQIVKGQWWKPDQAFPQPMVSVEQEAAQTLGVDIGSRMEFDIQGTRITAEVHSIRKVEWGNFSTNFYMILSPGALEGAPLTYVATARVPPKDEISLQQTIVASFPNVTAINVGDMLESFARVLDRLSLAVRAVALFCVVSGGLVMAAALAATRYRRLYESVILKSLGATRGLLARSFAVEYAVLGAMGGGLGSGLASALSWAVLTMLFDLSWSLQPKILLAGVAATVALTMMVGFLSTFRILGQPPLAVLRHE